MAADEGVGRRVLQQDPVFSVLQAGRELRRGLLVLGDLDSDRAVLCWAEFDLGRAHAVVKAESEARSAVFILIDHPLR